MTRPRPIPPDGWGWNWKPRRWVWSDYESPTGKLRVVIRGPWIRWWTFLGNE